MRAHLQRRDGPRRAACGAGCRRRRLRTGAPAAFAHSKAPQTPRAKRAQVSTTFGSDTTDETRGNCTIRVVIWIGVCCQGPQCTTRLELLARRLRGQLVEVNVLQVTQPGAELRVLRKVVILSDGRHLRWTSLQACTSTDDETD